MKENFLQYIWKYQLLENKYLTTDKGDKIEVIRPGEINRDAGPDFFNSRIKINETTWAGNIEVHINSSDWYRHGHNKNNAYDNVVLQVVKNNDKKVFRSNGEEIPTLELNIDNKYINSYDLLLKNEFWIPCQDQIKKIDKFIVGFWLEHLMIERLENKSNTILEILKHNKNNWEETFYQFIAKNFGFRLNSLSFEMLAKSLPLSALAKHKNNLLQLEAMLFGQAGFLNEKIEDGYYIELCKEYQFLKNKFSLKPLDKHVWKFLRLRPVNFPTIRIAQFASFIHNSSALFSKIIEAESLKEIEQLFIIQASEYWDNHYNFGKESAKRKKKFGKTAFNTIMINTIIPFLFVYGKSKDNQLFMDKAIRLMEELPVEKNHIINKWKEIGIEAIDARQSQALLQLKNVYCNSKKCLECQIGNQIISHA